MKSRESKRKSSESNNDKKTKDVKRSKTEVKTDKVSGNNQSYKFLEAMKARCKS